MSDAAKLDDVLARIEKRERSSQVRTVLFTMIPTCLAAALIVYYVQWTNAKQLELVTSQERAKSELVSREKDARVAELTKQVQGFMKGPVQAYVRPVEFGGKLVLAKDLASARKTLAEFEASPEPSIRTPDVTKKLQEIRETLAADGVAAPTNRLNLLAILLGKACKSAWEKDNGALGKETIQEFNRVLYQRAVDATQEIAKAKTYEATAKLRDEFWSLYWGELPLIETPDVASAMKTFGDALNEWKQGADPVSLKLQEKADAVAAARDEAMK
jgi:hypothetical protein